MQEGNELNKSKIAIITGASGMDGYYLSSHLLYLGYRVIAVMRRTSMPNDTRLRTLKGSPNFDIVYGDITDSSSMDRIVSKFNPDEFYHLAANSFVGCSWDAPAHVMETNTIGTINCLEALRKNAADCHFYFAGSSEMYGDYVKRVGGEVLLDEDSPMVAASPYGVSKVAGYQMTKVYRESYGMFATCGILFNHSAALRGPEFFTRKITSQLARVKWGLQDVVEVGNLSAQRDEGWSLDYCRAMVLMLQQEQPDDFVIATGETHSCQEWVDRSCEYFDLDPEEVIRINPDFFRPNEVNILIGDSSKARSVLGWSPEKDYRMLNRNMCEYDYHLQSPDASVKKNADDFLF